jgi:uncharacterized protein (TIGR02217 family)
MSFIETPRFPDNVAFGATGGPGYLTDVVFMNSGAESRNQTWAQARCSYEVSHAARLPAEYVPLRDFFRAMKGRTHGFRFKDWADFEVTVANGVLGTGVGAGIPALQLGKRYAAGALSEIRNITKLVTGTTVIYRNASPAVAGSGAGQYAVSTTTGLVTWVADAWQAISSFTVGTTTRVIVGSALTGAAMNKLVYLTGVTGTAATYLNSQAWRITDVSGGTNIGIAADTTGMTASGGTASMYPQASDALTWAGQFDVPCRFDTDRMVATAISKSAGQLVIDWDSIPIVEIRV